MSQIEINNQLDGKRLCNTLANVVVKKFEEVTPGCKSEISVYNHRSFFIVNGFTTSKKTINIAEIFKNYFNNFNDKLYETIKVIDIVKFVDVIVINPLNIRFKFDKKNEKLEHNLSEIIDEFFNKGIKVNCKIDFDNSTIFYQCSESEMLFVQEIKNLYPNFTLTKFNFKNLDYFSDRKHGLSFGIEKMYYFLGEYIKNHIFSKSISQKLNFSLMGNECFEKLNSENITLKIHNDDHIVNTAWLESLILDVFPFSESDLMKTFNKENLEEKIKDLDLINELILF